MSDELLPVLESLEATQLNLGFYNTRITTEDLRRVIAEALGDDPQAKAREYALDRLSLSLVLQACGRGIRSETDRCAFVLLDKRYHDYGWRRFLEPRPYNLLRPERTVGDFHRTVAVVASGEWDKALVKPSRRGITE